MIDAFTKACWGLVVCFNLLFLNTVTPPVFSIQGGQGQGKVAGTAHTDSVKSFKQNKKDE